MGTFDHSGLMQDINDSLAPFRKAQPEAMAGFGALAMLNKAGFSQANEQGKRPAECGSA